MAIDDDRLDPELLPIILSQRERNASRPPMGSVPPAEMRPRAAAEFVPWNADPPAIASVRDLSIAGEDGGASIPARFYDPAPDVPGACMIYFHGGGWIIGDLEIEDAAIRRMALAGGVKILSVDYRLAPEHPFPAATEDGERAFLWLRGNARDLGVVENRIALGGASAGANIALGTAPRLRDHAKGGPCALALLYGAFGRDTAMASHAEFGDGRFGLPIAAMSAFWNAYLGGGNDHPYAHPHAVPLTADLRDMPPAFLVRAELDVLADETDALAARMHDCGVVVETRTYRGAVHGFTQYAKSCALARAALEDTGAFLARF